MTRLSGAKIALLCLALVTLASAETVWSLAISRAPDPECLRSASGADAPMVAQPGCCARAGDLDGCRYGRTLCCNGTELVACPCRSGTPTAALSPGGE
jgi:hypothetical protein